MWAERASIQSESVSRSVTLNLHTELESNSTDTKGQFHYISEASVFFTPTTFISEP